MKQNLKPIRGTSDIDTLIKMELILKMETEIAVRESEIQRHQKVNDDLKRRVEALEEDEEKAV
jgi:hypothetical protein